MGLMFDDLNNDQSELVRGLAQLLGIGGLDGSRGTAMAAANGSGYGSTHGGMGGRGSRRDRFMGARGRLRQQAPRVLVYPSVEVGNTMPSVTVLVPLAVYL